MTSHLDLLPEATKASFSRIRDLLVAILDNLESFRIPVFQQPGQPHQLNLLNFAMEKGVPFLAFSDPRHFHSCFLPPLPLLPQKGRTR